MSASRLPTGRVELRVTLAGRLRVSSLEDPSLFEIATTENVSQHGIRVALYRPWLRDAAVLVTGPAGFSSQGRIVYCDRVSDGHFAAGICLENAARSWFENLEVGTSA